MKREELEIYHVVGSGINTGIADNESTEVWPKEGTEILFKAEADTVMDELEMTLACYEDEVHQLRKQLEDVQNTMATENTDLGMENFKIKERIKDLNAEIIAKDMAGAELVNENRELKKQVEKLEARIFNEKDLRKRACHALWLARAERASSEKAHYYIMSIYCEPHSNKQKWMKRIAFTWEKIERKCREKAEQYR